MIQGDHQFYDERTHVLQQQTRHPESTPKSRVFGGGPLWGRGGARKVRQKGPFSHRPALDFSTALTGRRVGRFCTFGVNQALLRGPGGGPGGAPRARLRLPPGAPWPAARGTPLRGGGPGSEYLFSLFRLTASSNFLTALPVVSL